MIPYRLSEIKLDVIDINGNNSEVQINLGDASIVVWKDHILLTSSFSFLNGKMCLCYDQFGEFFAFLDASELMCLEAEHSDQFDVYFGAYEFGDDLLLFNLPFVVSEYKADSYPSWELQSVDFVKS